MGCCIRHGALLSALSEVVSKCIVHGCRSKHTPQRPLLSSAAADKQSRQVCLPSMLCMQVELLRLWAKTAESDLLIAEALLGSRLSSLTTLDEALAAAFVTPVPPIRSVLLAASSPAAVMPGGSSTSCLPVLVRPVSTALLNELQSARGLAVCPSPVVKQLAAQVRMGLCWTETVFSSCVAAQPVLGSYVPCQQRQTLLLLPLSFRPPCGKVCAPARPPCACGDTHTCVAVLFVPAAGC